MRSVRVDVYWSSDDFYTVSKKKRTPIMFWNNSNKLCLIIIMISWENRQKGTQYRSVLQAYNIS